MTGTFDFDIWSAVALFQQWPKRKHVSLVCAGLNGQLEVCAGLNGQSPNFRYNKINIARGVMPYQKLSTLDNGTALLPVQYLYNVILLLISQT